MTTTVRELIEAKARTASVTLTADDHRRLQARLRAADVSDATLGSDLKIANTILDRAIASMQPTSASAGSCPRCSGPMRNVKLAVRQGCYCTSCRVVVPA